VRSTKGARRRRSLREIFAIPAALGVLSAFGLVAALVGDDIYDLAGWLALATPLALMTWHIVRPSHHS
jgi:hypothetical protein